MKRCDPFSTKVVNYVVLARLKKDQKLRKVEKSRQKTAGIDKVKSLTPKQRLELAENLKLKDKSKPIRRVWIPKPGREEKRPLGIPVMHDRAVQALAKAALEPEWEAKFDLMKVSKGTIKNYQKQLKGLMLHHK